MPVPLPAAAVPAVQREGGAQRGSDSATAPADAGVSGFTGRGWATISELADFLQERHNAVVALVGRASRAKLVRKQTVSRDHRLVRVELTESGRAILQKLSALHRKELARFEKSMKSGSETPARAYLLQRGEKTA